MLYLFQCEATGDNRCKNENDVCCLDGTTGLVENKKGTCQANADACRCTNNYDCPSFNGVDGLCCLSGNPAKTIQSKIGTCQISFIYENMCGCENDDHCKDNGEKKKCCNGSSQGTWIIGLDNGRGSCQKTLSECVYTFEDIYT